MKELLNAITDLSQNLKLVNVSPPGWGGTVRAMKKHKDIDNPFALGWWMKNRGDKPHHKED